MDRTRVRLVSVAVLASATVAALITFHVLQGRRDGAQRAVLSEAALPETALPAAPAAQPQAERTEQVEPPAPVEQAQESPKPSFDIVRVERSGEAVVAGRSNANWRVELFANGRIVGSAVANDGGEWVIIPDKQLSQVDQLLTLRTVSPDGKAEADSEQSVAVGNLGKADAPVVLLSERDRPSTVLQTPDTPSPALAISAAKEPAKGDVAAGGGAAASNQASVPAAPAALATTVASIAEPAKPFDIAALPKAAGTVELSSSRVSAQPSSRPEAGATPSAASPAPDQGAKVETAALPRAAGSLSSATGGSLAIETVEYEEAGRLYIGGKAVAGVRLRAYLNDTYLRDVLAGKGDRFNLALNTLLPEGQYRVRIDAVEPKSGRVLGRVEVSFEREKGPISSLTAEAKPKAGGIVVAADSVAGATASTDAGEPKVVIIKRGDSLWTIARKTYGDGFRYTTIFKANREQIRNPDKIYPGQIFVMPLFEALKAESSASPAMDASASKPSIAGRKPPARKLRPSSEPVAGQRVRQTTP